MSYYINDTMSISSDPFCFLSKSRDWLVQDVDLVVFAFDRVENGLASRHPGPVVNGPPYGLPVRRIRDL